MPQKQVVDEMVENAQQENKKLSWWHWHRHLYNWVLHFAGTKHGFKALIGLAIFEPICVPIPADVMVLGMSMANPRKAIKYGLTCSMFSVLGGTIAFLLGLLIGPERVVGFFGQISFGPLDLGEKAQMALDYYQKYDFWAVAISALTPVPYMLFSWLGGIAEISIIKFIAVSLVFRTMRFGTEGLLFYLFGRRARVLIEKYFNIATVIAIAVLALLVYIMRQISHMFN